MNERKVIVSEAVSAEMLRLLEDDPKAYFSQKPRIPFGFAASKARESSKGEKK